MHSEPKVNKEEETESMAMPRAVTVKAIEFDWIFSNTQGY